MGAPMAEAAYREEVTVVGLGVKEGCGAAGMGATAGSVGAVRVAGVAGVASGVFEVVARVVVEAAVVAGLVVEAAVVAGLVVEAAADLVAQSEGMALVVVVEAA